jgi:hypothetical protein
VFFCLLLNGLCGELSVDCWQISSIFYGFWDKIDRKRPKSANFQNLIFEIVHPNFNADFCNVFILMGYWWDIKLLFYFEKRSKRDQISIFMYNWKLYRFLYLIRNSFHFYWRTTFMGYNWTPDYMHVKINIIIFPKIYTSLNIENKLKY